MLTVLQVLLFVVNIVWFIVIAHVIMSWLINFQVLNLHQQLVAQIWYGLNRLTEPVYSRIRAFLPNLGGIDISPVIVIIILFAIQRLIENSIPQFYY